MTLGLSTTDGDLFDTLNDFCKVNVRPDSIYALLHRERDRLFPDSFFADLYIKNGRPSIPPSIVSTVMVLQKLMGLSDREAVERYTFDARWRYACGVGMYNGNDPDRFVHSVLVEMRARLRNSDHPNRVFEVVCQVADQAGLIGEKRVLDSTPLYDAVATMDTITLIRSAIRGLLAVVEQPLLGDAALAAELRAACTSGDTYASNAKPQVDWDDEEARMELVDSRAKDGHACLAVLDGRVCNPSIMEAGQLLATILGQDLEENDKGQFRIARRVAPDRIISTVDPDTRHGHKTSAHRFDGYKGHIAIDPDTEIITATRVTPGNAGDASVVKELVADIMPQEQEDENDDADFSESNGEVYGDSAYGTGKVLRFLEESGVRAMTKVQEPHARNGLFTKNAFVIDLGKETVQCPQGITQPIQRSEKHPDVGIARFGKACSGCPLRTQCTASSTGRTITIGAYEQILTKNREIQRDPAWKEKYRSTRPKVERKIGHLMFRKHGARRSRVWGLERVEQDFSWLAAAANLKRLAHFRIRTNEGGLWCCT